MNAKNFFAELKRRHVYKVAIAYAIVAWLLIQVATQVFRILFIVGCVLATAPRISWTESAGKQSNDP